MTDQLRKKFEYLQLIAGQGKISAFLSVSLGFLGIFAALCFLFPTVLTTPELRPLYSKHYDVFYYSLLFGIVLSASLVPIVRSLNRINMVFMVCVSPF